MVNNDMAKIPGFHIVMLLIFVLANGCASAKPAANGHDGPEFELMHGDRVVLLGNSLIQDEQEFGYMEYALTTRWPERDITFRNLGWTGDTVHGEARSYYTTPPESYDLLIQQLKEAKPTVVFIGYGANESYEGNEGIPRFKEGLNKLLDEIDKLEARAVLLSPIPRLADLSSSSTLPDRNADLKLYSDVISETASERNVRYVNLFDSFQNTDRKESMTTDGVHLNEKGYYYLATVLEDQLGLSSRQVEVCINLPEKKIDLKGSAAVVTSQFVNNSEIQFTLKSAILPFPPLPSDNKPESHERYFKISGLHKACYTLFTGADIAAAASAERWSAGLPIDIGAMYRQAQELRELIVQKNQLFFRKYRPTNRTYLVGFRSYEQGQNAAELEQLDPFISNMEDRISRLRKPHTQVYSIEAIQ